MKKNTEEIIVSFNVLIFALVITLTSYGNNKNEDYQSNIQLIHPQLESYVINYVNTLEDAGVDVYWAKDLTTIDFSFTMPVTTLGWALGMNVDNVTHIEINAYSFEYLSYSQREFLLFHELSHDLFNLEHFSTLLMYTPMPQYVDQLYINIAMNQLIEHLLLKQK